RLDPPREGLGLLGTPERDARPSWLAPLDAPSPTTGGSGPAVAVAAAAATAPPPPASPHDGPLPFWIEAAVRLGVRFWLIAAGGTPAAAGHYRPREFDAKPGCCAECGCEHPPQVDEYYFWLLDSRFFEAIDKTDSASFFADQQDDYYDISTQDATPWHDPGQTPVLLDWRSKP